MHKPRAHRNHYRVAHRNRNEHNPSADGNSNRITNRHDNRHKPCPYRNTDTSANRHRYDRAAWFEQNLHARGHQTIAGALGVATHGSRKLLHSPRTPSLRISVINSINKAW